MKKKVLYLFTFMMLCGAAFSPLFSQTYNQSSGDQCNIPSYMQYEFENTPETPVDANLNMKWMYCKRTGDDQGILIVIHRKNQYIQTTKYV